MLKICPTRTICPNTGKHGSEKRRILAFFTKWSFREGVLIFSKAGIPTAHIRFWIIFTTRAQQPYFKATITRKHFSKIASRRLQRMQSDHLTNIVFIQKRLSRKHTRGESGYLRPLLQTWWHYHTILNCLHDTCGHYIYVKKEKRDIDTFN